MLSRCLEQFIDANDQPVSKLIDDFKLSIILKANVINIVGHCITERVGSKSIYYETVEKRVLICSFSENLIQSSIFVKELVMDNPRFAETCKSPFFGKHIYDQVVPQGHFLHQLNKLIDRDRFTRRLLKLYRVVA